MIEHGAESAGAAGGVDADHGRGRSGMPHDPGRRLTLSPYVVAELCVMRNKQRAREHPVRTQDQPNFATAITSGKVAWTPNSAVCRNIGRGGQAPVWSGYRAQLPVVAALNDPSVAD